MRTGVGLFGSSMHIRSLAFKKDNGGRLVAVEIQHRGFITNVINVNVLVSRQPVFEGKKKFFQVALQFCSPDITNKMGEDFNTVESPTLNFYPFNRQAPVSKELRDPWSICERRDSCGHCHPNTKILLGKDPLSCQYSTVSTSILMWILSKLRLNHFRTLITICHQHN